MLRLRRRREPTAAWHRAALGKFPLVFCLLRRDGRRLLARRVRGGDLGAIAPTEHFGRATFAESDATLRGCCHDHLGFFDPPKQARRCTNTLGDAMATAQSAA